ncbi:MAG: peptide/nickel transport system ATP-binding protein [Myxococcota bacterium]|jgi:peptide/nickel transport system ATP-binding protein
MSAVLSVEGLSVSFPTPGGRLRAVHDLSMAVARGECVALVGESGSGKSTIARLITGLVAPESGTVLLDGAPLSGNWRKRIQLIFQDPFGSLNPAHTIRHHLARPLALHRSDITDMDAEIGALLTRTGLSPEYAPRRPFELSGGQRQRVAIARALAPNPDVIIADEPTSMLDVSMRMDILRLLKGLVEEQGVAMVFITHDLAAARFLADRIFVLYAGQVMEASPSDALVTDPLHPYTQLLIAAAPRAGEDLSAPLPGKPGRPPVIDPPPGCPFAARCPSVTDRCARPIPLYTHNDRQVRCILLEESP